MLRCPFCSAFYPTLKLYFAHLHNTYGITYRDRILVTCGQADCTKQFESVSGYTRHLKSNHSDLIESDDGGLFDNEFDLDDANTDQPPANSLNSSFMEVDESENQSDITQLACNVVCSLRSFNMSYAKIKTVTKSVSEMNSQAIEGFINKVGHLSEDEANELRKLSNPFKNIATEHKFNKFLQETVWKGRKLWEPVSKSLGFSIEKKFNKHIKAFIETSVTRTFEYVPILEYLQFVANSPKYSKYFRSTRSCDSSKLHDIRDGSKFKSNELFLNSPNGFQINLYYDDFEVANPLGSRKTIHKIGAVYFTLRNLPPSCNSKLENIHLLALFYVNDAKVFGLNSVFEVLIDDIIKLEIEGVQVSFQENNLRGTIVNVSADNLAANSMFGFVESFSATYYCRRCLITRDEAQNVFDEDFVQLRDKESFLEHCDEVERDHLDSVYGIKRRTAFSKLKYFNCVENYCPDIMHDILEGCVPYELKLLFEWLISSGYISQNDLFDRIDNFTYGRNARQSLPSNIRLSPTSNDLGLKASQTHVLVRSVLLIFDDLSDPEDRHWQLLMSLLDIMDIVFSPIASPDVSVYLKHLIIEHHELFKECYPERRLIPKQHFLVHYPRALRENGPLINLWTMRFESKHHQLQHSMKFSNFSGHSDLEVEFGPQSDSNSLPSKCRECILATLEDADDVEYFSWVKAFGYEYSTGMVLCLENSEECLPEFDLWSRFGRW